MNGAWPPEHDCIESRPVESEVTQVPAPDPKLETRKLVDEATPVLLMVKSVVWTPVFDVEAIEKSVVVAEVEAAKMLRRAVGVGDDEPIERPLLNAAASKSEVDEA